ncbi:unnamed protein product [Paramecium pentaurelia]|uniref:Protein kinase domain-containing protein n=1 Tax=Paramecium pentaurelia TaxID=43138 RepID=A0A8S1TT15_9CILI|nr:unnamed protein product [Paramecium pentaurelia]
MIHTHTKNKIDNQPQVSTEKVHSKSSDSLRKMPFFQQNNKESPVIIDNKYLLLNVIYQGKSSTIFEAINLNKQSACVIRMTILSKPDNSTKILEYFNNLHQFQTKTQDDGKHINKLITNFQDCLLKLHDHGIFINQYRYQVLNKTGPSIKFWFSFFKCHFTYECIILIILKSIDALQLIHSANFLHQNLNLASLLTCLDNQKNLLLTNFQQSSLYKTNQKISQNSYKLCKYSSIGQHLGLQLHPKDDLECLLYMVIELLTKGEFFNESKSFRNKVDKLKYYFDLKNSFLPEKILKNYPICFLEFANRIKFLNPNEIPINYEYLKGVFKGYKNIEYDWTSIIAGVKNQSQCQSQSLQQFEDNFKITSLVTIPESEQEQIPDVQKQLVKTQQSIGDSSDTHPDTQESDGELSSTDEIIEIKQIYFFY